MALSRGVSLPFWQLGESADILATKNEEKANTMICRQNIRLHLFIQSPTFTRPKPKE
jgi:hypothetical protein